MFKVLIVDDEPWSLKGISSSIKWNDLGFEVIIETTKSLEAMHIIEDTEPDVVVTDIRMPDLSGIDLLRRSREKEINSEFVIISGYAEFSYAQEALKFGAFSYILKPIKTEEIYDVFLNLAEHLTNKKHLEKRAYDSDIIDKILYNDPKIGCILKNMGLESVNDFYQVAILSGISHDDLQSFIDSCQLNFITIKISSESFMLIFNTSSNIFETLDSKLKTHYNMKDLSAGLSRPCSEMSNIPKKYREANIALCDKFVYGENRLYYYKTRDSIFVKDLTEELTYAIECKSTDIVNLFFEKFMVVFKDNNLGINEVAYFYNELAVFLTQNYSQNELVKELDFLSYEQIYQSYDNIMDFCSHFRDVILCLLENNLSLCTSANENFNKVLFYVNSNFTCKLSLNYLAEKFHFNSNYLCELFKKYTNKTFSKHLLRLRLEYAAMLLKSSNMTVFEIADKVGYNNYCYFNKTFKKMYNVTPNKFRKN